MIARIQNLTHPLPRPFEVKYCATFFTKLLGLMFQKEISPYSGVLLVEPQDSVIATTIHMLFMNFDICAVWIDQSGSVVDVQLAKRWRLIYKPQKPASLVLETHKDHLSDIKVDDKIDYEII
jgi:uncharacterized membrane protein (UPF0127 family)